MNFAYAAPQNVKVGLNTGILESILSASPVVQITLLLLIGLSIMSWAIILAKRRQFSNVRAMNEDFLEVFWKSPSLDAIHEKLDEHEGSPVAQIFSAGYSELQRLAESAPKSEDGSKSPKLEGIDNLARALRKSMDNEIIHLESNLNFLATTSSNAPFVGLFGTVWGIMTSFHQIGVTGSANLAVVAPGISEALVATAIGLATAIPAGAAYNFFLSKIKREELELSNFTADFLNIAKRNFFKGE
jgi:biopolymer transport protein TolQ